MHTQGDGQHPSHDYDAERVVVSRIARTVPTIGDVSQSLQSCTQDLALLAPHFRRFAFALHVVRVNPTGVLHFDNGF